jgi:L-asparaginase
MKRYSLLMLLIVIIISTNSASSKPNVHIIATGGTIAGVGESSVKTNYNSGKVEIDQLLDAVPEISEIANITGEQIVDIGSQDMNNEVWLLLSKRINEILSDSKTDGIVITHGTDTMEETAFFLNLTVKSSKPVVLVGSMRPSTEISADGPLNLFNAVVVASDKKSIGKGVLIAMNGDIISARSALKANTIDVQTFNVVNEGVLGYVFNDKVFYDQESLKKHTTESDFDVANQKDLPKVGIVYGYSNINPDMIEPMIENNYQGIIFAGVGNGNIHKDVLPALVKAREKGIIIVRSSRVPTGPTTLDAEFDDNEYEFIASNELNPQKSRILLMLALTKTKNWKDIQKYFNEY